MKDESKLRLIAISYAKRALETGTRERARMLAYAEAMGEYHLIVFTRKHDGYPAYVQDGNLHLYATNTRTRLGMMWQAFKIGRRILAQRGGDWVVSSQDPFETSVVGSAVAFGNRATHHIQIHGDVFNPRSYQVSLLQRVRATYGHLAVRRADGIRVVSSRIKRSLLSLGVSEEKITVLPIFSDITAFKAVGVSRNYAVGGRVSFLYVGRFAPEKNLPFLIDAFAQVAVRYPNTSLTLVGGGSLQKVLEKQITALGLQSRVTFIPWTENVAAIMATHDIFCLTSNHEGWGMVLVEAAAAGMPVITTDVGCAGECVRSGETGQVVLVGDRDHYVQAMEVYLKNHSLVATEGVRGHKLALETTLDEAAYITQLVESYASCVPR